MITAKPTPHLGGIECAATIDDIHSLAQAVERMNFNFPDDREDSYWSVKYCLNRRMEELRYSVENLDNAMFKQNGVTRDMMKKAAKITPRENVFFTFKVPAPEAVILGLALQELCKNGYAAYRDYSYAVFYRDKAILELFAATMMQAIGEITGRDGLDDFYIPVIASDEPLFRGFLWQLLDVCNIEYLQKTMEQRPSELRSGTGSLLSGNGVYRELAESIRDYAGKNGQSVYDVGFYGLKYPDEIDW